MINIKKILVTTDLSEASYSAMEYAAWLSEKEKAAVTIFYSVDNLPTVAYHTVDLTFDKFRLEILNYEQQRLNDFTQKFKKQFIKNPTVVLTEGNASQSIVEYAKKNTVDIIIMSTHGRTGIGHVILGSVAERVVRSAHCPVLTVKSNNSQVKQKKRMKKQ